MEGIGIILYYPALVLYRLNRFYVRLKMSRTIFYPVTHYGLCLLALLLWQKTILIGVENLPTGGCVLGAKHWSNNDPPLLTQLLKRMIYYMGKAELFKSAFVEWYFRHAGVFPVDRDNRKSFMQAIGLATELVSFGKLVVIFLEGTKTPGLAIGEIHGGAAKVAKDAGVPIVLVAIVYDGLKPNLFKFRQKSVVILSEPISPEKLSSQLNPKEFLRVEIGQLMLKAQNRLEKM